MRVFISINLSDEVKGEISEFMNLLKSYDAPVRWVRPEGIHLTIKFLGEVERERVELIRESLSKDLTDTKPFSITLKGTGVFPDYRRPRVLWIGIEPSDNLLEVYNKTEDSLSNIGFKKETRPFRPHITIGRVKGQYGLDPVLREIRGHKSEEFGKIDVSGIHIMESLLRPEGAVYRSVYDLNFREGGSDG
ncbi:MAG: RNA 2',3'-cyclic phosphodiesterase [Nitrospirae bacterium]|nr:MAG: RNA 2',3'-cyclic phosphodiesterase [Nitrospirota bacterium]